MSSHDHNPGSRVFAQMRARSPHDGHRAATPLELLFDLVFVVAIAQVSAALHHAISEAHAVQGAGAFLMVFFAIWWAWMNFTWFASAYDCDDVPYRLAVFVQITGALVLAAGVKSMAETSTVNGAAVGGFVIMRLAQVGQWIRAARSDPDRSATALRYALGIAACQVLWIALYFSPHVLARPAFVVFAALELMVPMWAESRGHTTWHPAHITERYGLFTIIVLGESILSATVAVQQALASGERFAALAPVIVGGLLIVYAMWWLYFYRPFEVEHSERQRYAFVWGYGHFFVFTSAAAVGAGLAVVVDAIAHKAHISHAAAGAAVALPAAVYILSLSVLHYRPGLALSLVLNVITALMVLITPIVFGVHAVLATGVILTLLLATKITRYYRSGAESAAA